MASPASSTRSDVDAPIAFFGGSFNPVHRGHLYVARRALAHFRYAAIHFLPARCPPHKSPTDLLPEELRLELLRLATRREKRFVVDDFEIRHPEYRYTFDTLCALEKIHPTRIPLHFLIGGDSLRDLPKWYRSRELVERFVFVTVPRDPALTIDDLLAPARAVFDAASVARLRANVLPVSPFVAQSTTIRAGLTRDEVRRLLPRAVASRLEELQLLRTRGSDHDRPGVDDHHARE